MQLKNKNFPRAQPPSGSKLVLNLFLVIKPIFILLPTNSPTIYWSSQGYMPGTVLGAREAMNKTGNVSAFLYLSLPERWSVINRCKSYTRWWSVLLRKRKLGEEGKVG